MHKDQEFLVEVETDEKSPAKQQTQKLGKQDSND
jgi:hypothetical protein